VQVRVAGRILADASMGKAAFAHLNRVDNGCRSTSRKMPWREGLSFTGCLTSAITSGPADICSELARANLPFTLKRLPPLEGPAAFAREVARADDVELRTGSGTSSLVVKS